VQIPQCAEVVKVGRKRLASVELAEVLEALLRALLDQAAGLLQQGSSPE
jgi:hypothetical protein